MDFENRFRKAWRMLSSYFFKINCVCPTEAQQLQPVEMSRTGPADKSWLHPFTWLTGRDDIIIHLHRHCDTWIRHPIQAGLVARGGLPWPGRHRGGGGVSPSTPWLTQTSRSSQQTLDCEMPLPFFSFCHLRTTNQCFWNKFIFQRKLLKTLSKTNESASVSGSHTSLLFC